MCNHFRRNDAISNGKMVLQVNNNPAHGDQLYENHVPEKGF